MKKEIILKLQRILQMSLMALLLLSSICHAGDFDWMRDFNVRAEADPIALRARLEARFRVGGMDIQVALGNADSPADAYMLLRLGEMAHQPIGLVVEKYKSQKGKGWGALAKSLGIKPGSGDFHALKQGHDLHDDGGHGKGESKGNGKGKGNGKKSK